MVRMIVAGILALAITLIFFSAYASDQPAAAPQNLSAEARTACVDDYRKFCSDTRRGQGRVWTCLKSRESELSAACRNVIAQAGKSNARQ